MNHPGPTKSRLETSVVLLQRVQPLYSLAKINLRLYLFPHHATA